MHPLDTLILELQVHARNEAFTYVVCGLYQQKNDMLNSNDPMRPSGKLLGCCRFGSLAKLVVFLLITIALAPTQYDTHFLAHVERGELGIFTEQSKGHSYFPGSPLFIALF